MKGKRMLISTECGAIFQWEDRWLQEIPYLNFPSHWNIKIIPPYYGAIVRFEITTNLKNCVSVYLDCYDMLGCVGEPYWEICPYEGDCLRVLMNNTDELINAIQVSLNQQDKVK